LALPCHRQIPWFRRRAPEGGWSGRPPSRPRWIPPPRRLPQSILLPPPPRPCPIVTLCPNFPRCLPAPWVRR
jgi:hypothetical protein